MNCYIEKQKQEIMSTEEYLVKKKIIGRSDEDKNNRIGDYLSEISLFSSFFFDNL